MLAPGSLDRLYQRLLNHMALLAIAALPSLVEADYPIASHRYLADPAVLVHDGRVYLYCSNDDENVGHEDYMMQSLVCISSSDLKNWTDHGVVFQVPENAAWADRSWAPAVIARNDTFYLYFGNGGSGIGVAVSDSPTGPFEDPIGKLLISWSTPGAGGESMWLFDPFAFIDDDGQAYLYFGGNGEDNARIIKLNEDMTSVDGAALSLTAPGFFEAAWMHKRDDTYYFSYSTDPANGLRIDYMTSDNPTTGFTYRGTVAGQPPSNNNNNHHGIFEFEEQWYHVYHNRFVANQNGDPPGYLRNLGIEPLFHKEDGSIEQIVYRRNRLTQTRHLDPYARVEGETIADQSGVKTEPCSEGGMALAEFKDGDWVALRGVDFRLGAKAFTARVASASNGDIELRLGSVDGPLIGACSVAATGGIDMWASVNGSVDPDVARGVHDLFLVFTGAPQTELFKLNWWQIEAALAPPGSLTASAASSASIRVTWAPVGHAKGYRIERASEEQGPYTVIAEEVSDSVYTDAGLEEGSTHFYRVSAIGDAGVGAASAPATATTAPNFDEWILAQFPNETDQAVLAPESDFDQDGLSNLAEYYHGSGPRMPSDSAVSLQFDGAGLTILVVRRSKALAAVEMAVKLSADLENWIEEPLTFFVVAETPAFQTLEGTVDRSRDATFLRLVINRVP